MTLRLIKDSEIELATQWFEMRTGTKLPEDVLSKCGYIAIGIANKPLACLFAYPVLNSKVCFVGWPITNPEANKDERRDALDRLIIAVEEMAKLLGYTYLNTYASVKVVEERFVNHGFIYGDLNVNQLIKKLVG
jgi:hypothetical protein